MLSAPGASPAAADDPVARTRNSPHKPATATGTLVALVVVAVAYFVLARLGLLVASISPSASPVWPASGFAVAATLLAGYRVVPAILIGAFAANLATTDAVTATIICVGNAAEALTACLLIQRWCGGRATFESPIRVALFALVTFVPSTMVSATVGVGAITGFDYDLSSNVWTTWWLGDAAGILMLAPALVLWANQRRIAFGRQALQRSAAVAGASALAGFVAFSPVLSGDAGPDPLTFVAVLPLLWAALRRGPRDTALASLILAVFAVWGALTTPGVTGDADLNQSFLLLLSFMVSISVPCLALSADVAVRREAEARVREQERELRAIFAQAVVGIGQADASGRLVLVNNKFAAIMARPPGELLGWHLADLAAPPERTVTEARLADPETASRGVVLERKLTRPDGTDIWIRSNVSAVLNPDRKIGALVAMVEDVTDRHNADEQQQMLMGELDHRVRNVLATVLATAQLTGQTAHTKDAYVASLKGRIGAMARTHSLLNRGRWRGASLRQVIEDELSPYASNPAAFTVGGPDGVLPPRKVLNLAMVVHELATNAAKYGALSVPDGRVSVTWRITGTTNDDRRLRLLWQETGGPFVSAPAQRGFGTHLIERGAVEPGSDVKLSFAAEGVTCLIDFPLPTWAAQEEGRGAPAFSGPAVPPKLPPSSGQRVLLLEDEPIVALELAAALTEAGLDVVGPAYDLQQADALIAEPVAAAVLDVNVGGAMTFPIAERLLAQGVMVLFVTGYELGALRPESLRHVPVLQKPATGEQVADRVLALLRRSAPDITAQ